MDSMHDHLQRSNQELYERFINLSNHVKMVEVQVSQIAEGSKRQANVLPGKVEENPKFCKVITTKKKMPFHQPLEFNQPPRSTVNLMSKIIARKLGIVEMEPPGKMLKFADASSTTPCGFVRDLEMQVGGCLVPTDFHINRDAR
ncbi:unnamed protein product [Microthlaspi erraticum]|uniref:Uncharacterized protein n=1 Tax=Microthlaspi erraticum TaxID=1685480 RepID=A0A6D2IJB8_9BRAS|nr:unnamed protein product [Microthlaspi erraticum]